KASAVLLSLAVLAVAPAAAQSKATSIQGVWQVVEGTTTGPGARTITGVEQNMTIITASHYSRVQGRALGPRPMAPDLKTASAEDLRAVWGPFAAEAGTYELIGGNTLTTRPIVSKNPAPGSFGTYSYKLEGDTIWVTEQRNQNGLVAN